MIRKPHAAGRRAAAAIVLAGLVGGTVAGAAEASPVRFHAAYGVDRYMTSAIADSDPTDTAFLVTGENYPDGLTAGATAGAVFGNVYLVQKDSIPQSVRERLVYAQQIVVVGSEASISADVMTWLQQNTRAHLSRIKGEDRFETAANLSKAWYPLVDASTGNDLPVSNVVIATGWNYPDALAGSAAAAHETSPLLLVDRDQIPASVVAELQRLQPQNITVVGGTERVSDTVLAQLQTFTSGTVARVAGSDRYQTADRISAHFFDAAAHVTVVSGETYADALAAGARAGRLQGPLLLTARTCVTEGTNLEIERLQETVEESAASLESFGYTTRISEAANKRTNCQPVGTAPKTYFDELAYVEGSARYRYDHATIGGRFYPRSTAFDTDPRYEVPDTEYPNADYGTWTLGTKYSRFTAAAGIADGNTSGLTSIVRVYGDEKLLGEATVSRGVPATFDLDVRGVDRIKVTTTSTGSQIPPTADESNYVYIGDAAVS
ncbi:cell wall-binding repeat-containing protein [Kineococcus sp. SYSU DK003]|uniref:cell wall-binding repeat-containing protein n=1 Tax=Kineococcus sp. SYSU DK003 TaxID=3383124 RepID=UPI003D7C671B